MSTIFLETDRLMLRRFTEADAQLLYDLDSDPEVTRFVDGGQPPILERIRTQVLPRLLSYYTRYEGFGFWAAIEKGSGEFLGWFHFRPTDENPDAIELGYRLKREAWGKGYATEGARALVAKGFEELGVERVVAMALAANHASRRVMEKAGLRYVGSYEETRIPGSDRDAVIYRVDRHEYTGGVEGRREHPAP